LSLFKTSASYKFLRLHTATRKQKKHNIKKKLARKELTESETRQRINVDNN